MWYPSNRSFSPLAMASQSTGMSVVMSSTLEMNTRRWKSESTKWKGSPRRRSKCSRRDSCVCGCAGRFSTGNPVRRGLLYGLDMSCTRLTKCSAVAFRDSFCSMTKHASATVVFAQRGSFLLCLKASRRTRSRHWSVIWYASTVATPSMASPSFTRRALSVTKRCAAGASGSPLASPFAAAAAGALPFGAAAGAAVGCACSRAFPWSWLARITSSMVKA
mmetsp:Transcript_8172/g.27750  ORF Transcript_8172/g.27750 Transcript_8172/m.27750 type:complete len:219 (-) Transcript_8172:274-930(-)